MKRIVIYHELAERELNDVAQYYSAVREGLPIAFLDAVDQAIASIVEYPAGRRSLVGDIRIWRLRRFPYSIVYRTLDPHVRVLAIAGQRRRPFY